MTKVPWTLFPAGRNLTAVTHPSKYFVRAHVPLDDTGTVETVELGLRRTETTLAHFSWIDPLVFEF